MFRTATPLIATALTTFCALGLGSSAEASAVATPLPAPALPPASDFVAGINNPWFSLRPGTVLTYKGESDGTPATDVFRVTSKTKTILGIRAIVVDDRVFMRGRLEERTNDWYAQDKVGNVWYLGEQTATLHRDGSVASTKGTWQAGVDGARAGIFMPANPQRGDAGAQEHYEGHAEDTFTVLSTDVAFRNRAAHSSRAMLVRETTPLEPGVVDHKYYARGIGTVREATVKGGNEQYTLVAIRRR